MAEHCGREGPLPLSVLGAITALDKAQLANVLSGLRSGGHVVTSPMPERKREKLWSVAP
jgi:hypothetical protein